MKKVKKREEPVFIAGPDPEEVFQFPHQHPVSKTDVKS